MKRSKSSKNQSIKRPRRSSNEDQSNFDQPTNEETIDKSNVSSNGSETLSFPNSISPPLKTAVSTVQRIRAEFLAGTRTHSFVPSDGATEIVDGFLWIGSFYDADEDDGEWLDDAGITHVLNCATEDVQGNVEGRKYLLLDAQDQHGYKIIEQHWSAARAFLFDARHTTNAKVLVHCSAGINRSATMVCAYLMESRSIGVVEAATEILKKRPISLCNESFLMQLAELERSTVVLLT